MTQESRPIPKTDPSGLLRLRDSIYASDLIIAAITWLDFFSWLSENPSNQETICSVFEIDRRPTDVMLTLLTSMGFIRHEGGKYYVLDLAKDYLVQESSWNLRPYFESMKERPTCKDMLQVLKTGKPASWGSKKDEAEWIVAMQKEEVAKSFTAAMDSRGAYLAPAMAERLYCSEHEALLDIAGGSGIYACALVAQNDHLRAAVLEKPPVDNAAKYFISKKGLADRVAVITRDMFDELPHGFDIHLFSNVLHDWGEPALRSLLRNSFEALPTGGVIAVHDAHINADKTGPLAVAEFSVLLMYSTEGKCYSVTELNNMLQSTGFTDPRFIPTIADRSIITAKKPV